MADNVAITPGSGATAAADDVGGVLYQRIKITTGTDGVADGDVSSANPMPVKIPGVTSDAPLPVRLDQGPEGIISNNGSLQVDATQVNEQSAESLNANNAILLGDEPVQMVGLHPSYPLPIDTATPMPIAGRDPVGAQRQFSVNANGEIILAAPSDTSGIEKSFARVTYANVGLPQFDVYDTKGYAAAFILYEKGGNNFVGVEFSNDRRNWVQGLWYVTSGVVNSGTGTWQYGINPGGTYNIIVPCYARYMRFASNVGSAETTTFTVTLKAVCSVPIPITGQVVASNITQIGGVAVAATSAQLGVNSFGPTAPGAAHSTNNPVQMSGSDGTNVRRILTDTSGNTRVVGPLAAGTSLIPPTNAAFAPELMGLTDLQGTVQRAAGDVRGRLAATLPDATAPAEDGIIDALNNVVRELKLLNAKITDLPYWLGINSVMPDDGQIFRDDPTLFNQ